jgi:hypothetical protein
VAETMTERRQRLHDEREVPEGYELTAVPSKDWRLVTGKRCRYGSGPGHPACGAASIAELDRNSWSSTKRANWWAYCPEHLYGHWIEDGKVMHWILREKQADG